MWISQDLKKRFSVRGKAKHQIKPYFGINKRLTGIYSQSCSIHCVEALTIEEAREVIFLMTSLMSPIYSSTAGILVSLKIGVAIPVVITFSKSKEAASSSLISSESCLLVSDS